MQHKVEGVIVGAKDKYMYASGFNINLSRLGKADYDPFFQGNMILHYGRSLISAMKIRGINPETYFAEYIGKRAQFTLSSSKSSRTYQGKTTSTIKLIIEEIYVLDI